MKTDSEKHEARVAEAQQELKDAITKCEDLEQKNKDQSSELSKVNQEFQEARMEVRGAREELRQVKQIVDGKPYLLQSVFGGQKFALHTRVWHSSGMFAELSRSEADAARHYATQEGDIEDKLFSVLGARTSSPSHKPDEASNGALLYGETSAARSLCPTLAHGGYADQFLQTGGPYARGRPSSDAGSGPCAWRASNGCMLA